MKDRVEVSAPGKLMLLGEHAVVYNRPCLVTAVNQRMQAIISRLDEDSLQIEAPDVSVIDYSKPLSEIGQSDIPKGAKFVEIAVANFRDAHPFEGGLRIETKSEFNSQFGFGSSSASTVCTIKALSEITGANLSNKQIFDLSYKTVLDIQGTGSGYDVASGIYGGIIYFVTGGQEIEPLDTNRLPLIVGYSGVKANTVTLINQVKEKFNGKQSELDQIYDQIAALTDRAREAFQSRDLPQLGDLMNQNQTLLERLGVSTPKLDQMIKAAIDTGAYGAKLSGAGGGDCMIALAPDDKIEAIKQAINRVGGQALDVSPNAEGVRIER